MPDISSSPLPFDDHTTPAWLNGALTPYVAGGIFPDDVIADIPVLVLDDGALNPEQMCKLLVGLASIKDGTQHSLVHTLHAQVPAILLDQWITYLLYYHLMDGQALWHHYREAHDVLDTASRQLLNFVASDALLLRILLLLRHPDTINHDLQRIIFGALALHASSTAVLVFFRLVEASHRVRLAGVRQKMVQMAKRRGMNPRTEIHHLWDDARANFVTNEKNHLFLGDDRETYAVYINTGQLSLRAASGQHYHHPPAGVSAAIRRQWKLLRRKVRETRRAQLIAIEQVMVQQRRLPWDVFVARYLSDPVMLDMARHIVWGLYDKGGNLRQSFRVADEGAFLNSDDHEVGLDRRYLVGIVHRLDINEAEQLRWNDIFLDYEMLPLFEQMNRPIYALPDELIDDVDLKSVLPEIYPRTIRLSSLFWQQHLNYRWCYFGADDVSVVLHATSGWQKEQTRILSCKFVAHRHHDMYSLRKMIERGKFVRLGWLSDVTISEVIREVKAAFQD